MKDTAYSIRMVRPLQRTSVWIQYNTGTFGGTSSFIHPFMLCVNEHSSRNFIVRTLFLSSYGRHDPEQQQHQQQPDRFHHCKADRESGLISSNWKPHRSLRISAMLHALNFIIFSVAFEIQNAMEFVPVCSVYASFFCRIVEFYKLISISIRGIRYKTPVINYLDLA